MIMPDTCYKHSKEIMRPYFVEISFVDSE